MKKAIFIAAFLLVANVAQAEVKKATTGHIEELSTYLETHTTASVRGIVDFKLDVDLASPCTRVYLDQAEQAAVSMLLAAKAKDKAVRVYYYTDVIGPWSSTTCQVYALREY